MIFAVSFRLILFVSKAGVEKVISLVSSVMCVGLQWAGRSFWVISMGIFSYGTFANDIIEKLGELIKYYCTLNLAVPQLK